MRPLTRASLQSKIAEEVFRERDRQTQLMDAGKFLWTCASTTESNARKLAVLAEEFGEVSREVMEQIIAGDKKLDTQKFEENLEKELIQVSAVCFAWIESIRERRLR